MSLKLKLSSIIVAMITVVIAVLAVVLLVRASRMQNESMYLYAREISESNAIELQRRVEVFADYGHIISMIMNEYETTPENLRRDTYNDILLSTIQQNELILSIWTAWLPRIIDSYHDELGQYQTFYTRRRTGNVEHIPDGYDDWQGYLAEMIEYKKPNLEEPVWREVFGYGNVPVISVNFPIKNSSGSVVGVLGINYVSDMQEIVDGINKQVYDGKGVAGVYSSEGVIVAHYVNEYVGENIKTSNGEKELLGDQHNRVVQFIKNGGENGNTIAINRYSPVLEVDIHMIFYPIFITGFDNSWCLLLAIPMNEINRPINDMIIFTVIFAIAILVITVIVTFFAASVIVKPIISVTNTLKDISEGEGDLTRRIHTNSKDEAGELSRYFNLTLEKIKDLIIIIKNEASNLLNIGADLASNMNETASAINEITASVQSIKGRVINQSASVTETNATMEQVTGNIHKLNGHIEEQSAHVSQASASVEQMAANIQSVNDTLAKNSSNVKSLREASEIGRSGIQDVASDIQGIARESEGLLEINSVMENIASQTNLLSMNAAIEAAHAGEAGKGFAVVADEIRKLAESSGEQSKTIGAVLKKIKGSIDKITKSTENVLRKFEAIDSNVRIVAEQEDNIRSAMEEQGTGSKQLLEGITRVNEITREVNSGSEEMLDGAREVIQESVNLEKMTQEITSGMNEMASGADQINIAVHKVNELSGKNHEGISSLLAEVSRFKVD